MPYSDKAKKYILTTRCTFDTYMDVFGAYTQMYGKATILYNSDGYYEIIAELNWDPHSDGANFDMFVDAVRNIANYGWPEYDPFSLRVEE